MCVCACVCNICKVASFYRFYRWGSTALARRRGWRTLGRRSQTPRSAPHYLVRSGTTRKATAVGREKGMGHRNMKRGLVILLSRWHKYERFPCNQLKLKKILIEDALNLWPFSQNLLSEYRVKPRSRPLSVNHFTLHLESSGTQSMPKPKNYSWPDDSLHLQHLWVSPKKTVKQKHFWSPLYKKINNSTQQTMFRSGPHSTSCFRLSGQLKRTSNQKVAT